MIGDILVKIAKREPLTFIEQQELSLWITQRDENNKFALSIQDGTGTINCNRIDTVSGSFRWQPCGLSSKIRFSATVPGDGSSVAATFTEYVYDELGGFSVSDSYNILRSGWYEAELFCNWETNNSGYRRHTLRNMGGFSHSTENAPLTFNGVFLSKSFFRRDLPAVVGLSQNSGVDLGCTGTLRLQLWDKSGFFSD